MFLFIFADSFVNSQEWTISRSVPDLRLGIVGSLSSGKSALVHRYLTGSYMQEESPEGGRFKKEVFIDNQSYLLLIRDEGGPPEMQVRKNEKKCPFSSRHCVTPLHDFLDGKTRQTLAPRWRQQSRRRWEKSELLPPPPSEIYNIRLLPEFYQELFILCLDGIILIICIKKKLSKTPSYSILLFPIVWTFPEMEHKPGK